MNMYEVSKLITIRIIEGRMVAVNEYNGQTRRVNLRIAEILLAGSEASDYATWLERIKCVRATQKAAQELLNGLIGAGFLLPVDSEQRQAEVKFLESWPWGRSTASHHLVTRRLNFLKEDAEAEAFADIVQTKGLPRLWSEPTGCVIALDHRGRDSEVIRILSRRRTYRVWQNVAVDIQDLGQILWAGLGITGTLNLPGRPLFPQKSSPSAGGLNAVSGYVIAGNLKGATPGRAYRYHGMSHCLELIDSKGFDEKDFYDVVNYQSWSRGLGCLVVLVADYAQMGWKYADASGYNAVNIEAGHIAQSIALAATELGLGAVNTNALKVNMLENVLKLIFPEQAAVYAIGIGVPVPGPEGYGDYPPDLLKKFLDLSSNAGETSSGVLDVHDQ